MMSQLKPKSEEPCAFYTIEQVIPFLVALIVKNSKGVAEMITLKTGEKELTYLSFDGKLIDGWIRTLQLAATVYRKNKIAVVPLNIICKDSGHLNMLIFNPKKKTVERYEPHGLESPDDCNGANTVLDNELKANLIELLPDATYIPRADTDLNGFQTREEKASEHPKESGFCATWSTMFAQERIRRPTVSGAYAIKQMRSKFGSDSTDLRNIVRKQAKTLKTNIGFDFDKYMNTIFYTPSGKLKAKPGKAGGKALAALDGKLYTSYIKSLFPKPKAKSKARGEIEV